MKSVSLLLLWLVSCACLADSYDPSRAAFDVWLNDYKVQHSHTFRALMPGEVLKVRAQSGVSANLDGVVVAPVGGVWQLPAPGTGKVQLLVLQHTESKALLTVAILGLVPATEIKNGKLNGYQIGSYPPPYKGLASYQAPKGYIALTPETETLRVSPHFLLGEFKCKQASGYPKYLVLRPRLLEKLEFLLEDLNARGINAPGFVVMSGYRTPHYNRSIGNVGASRHLYGGAADVYVDADGNGNMDDLNNDGKANIEDARLLYNLADSYVKRTGATGLTGGVGLYDKNAYHGPFVHIDVRGSKARWGD